MSTESNVLGEVIKRQRAVMGLTLAEVSEKSGVSTSHLGRIERGERFPSARILRNIAKALGFDENELFVIADYLSPRSADEERTTESVGRVDPYVAMVLGKEPVEVQHKVIAILILLKSIAKGLPNM